MHVVQFTNMTDFIADLDAGETAAVYHELVENRVATSDYGLTRWQMSTIIRAIVANHRVTHVAALTIPHGRPVERINGANFDPRDNEETRWQHGREQHDVIIDELRTRYKSAGKHGLIDDVRAGILDIPGDVSLIYAAHPLEDEPTDQEATALPG